MPDGPERAGRLSAVLHVLYLIFNEGYTATAGEQLTAPVLSDEAIRLTRWLQPAAARRPRGHRPARADAADRRPAPGAHEAGRRRWSRWPSRTAARWDRDRIAEGDALISAALPRGEVGPYQLQAAIAAVHDEAASLGDTDWPQILALYDLLVAGRAEPGDGAEPRGGGGRGARPGRGPGRAGRAGIDQRMKDHHRLLAVRAHLLELAGDRAGAAACYRDAARTSDQPAGAAASGQPGGPAPAVNPVAPRRGVGPPHPPSPPHPAPRRGVGRPG